MRFPRGACVHSLDRTHSVNHRNGRGRPPPGSPACRCGARESCICRACRAARLYQTNPWSVPKDGSGTHLLVALPNRRPRSLDTPNQATLFPARTLTRLPAARCGHARPFHLDTRLAHANVSRTTPSGTPSDSRRGPPGQLSLPF